MKLYDKLKQRKRNGETLDMKKITYETLYQLWWKEECTDGTIADLYDVPKKKVTNLRHTWGVKVPETVLKEFDERCGETITLDESTSTTKSSLKRITPEGTALLRKIEELNDLELESLRLELARRYTAFAQVKQEVEFFQVLEQVIREHWV